MVEKRINLEKDIHYTEFSIFFTTLRRIDDKLNANIDIQKILNEYRHFLSKNNIERFNISLLHYLPGDLIDDYELGFSPDSIILKMSVSHGGDKTTRVEFLKLFLENCCTIRITKEDCEKHIDEDVKLIIE